MKNLLILLPVIAGVGFASYLLYRDYHPAQTSVEQAQSKDVIGQMEIVTNNVKRQLGNDVMWDSINSKNPVYNHDSVRTGKDSQAVVKLDDGTLIELSENSLVVLEKSPKNFNINFKAGDLSTKNAGQGLQINVKDAVIKGAGADLNLKTGTDLKTQIEVAKGKASLFDKNKKQTDLGTSDQAGLDENGVTISKQPVILDLPKDKTEFKNNALEFSLPFKWIVSDPQLKTEQIELSKNNLFKKEDTKTFSAHQAFTAKLNQGIWFWRVSWKDHDKTLHTDIRQLNILPDKRIDLVYPENGATFNFEPEENSIDLRWNSEFQAKVYIMEVSTNKDFSKLTAVHTIKETKDVVKELPSQTYYWRVQAIGEKNETLGLSATSTFAVKVKLAKLPNLLKPADDAVWEDPIPVAFSWEAVEDGASYRIVISKDAEQKEILKTKTGPELNYSFKQTNGASLYWSVKVLSSKGAILGQSETRHLQVKIKDKGPAFEILNPKDQTEVVRDLSNPEPDPILFQWKTLRTLPGPISIMISKDPEFKDAVKQDNLSKLSVSVRLRTASIYYWKLVSASADGKISEMSSVATFTLKPANNLLSPDIIEPGQKDNIEVDGASPVKFSWKPVTGAASYHVVVTRLDPRTEKMVTVLDRVVKETTITSTPMEEGSYSWTISSMDDQGKDGLVSKPYTFSMSLHEEAAPPELNDPVVK